MLHKNGIGLQDALSGIRTAWNEEMNFRIQIALGIAAILLGLAFRIEILEWIAISFAIGLVLAAEIFNTALEELCDMYKSDPDPHIAKIKDLAAAAVLVSSTTAGIIGAIIFIPRLF